MANPPSPGKSAPGGLCCIAHRGGRGHGVENTLATIEKSLALGVDGIEIDVWLVNGELLITHDRLLGRVIQGEGRLLDLPQERMPGLRNYDGSKVARLQQVLDLVGDRALLNIELKGPGCAPQVAQAVVAHSQQQKLDLNRFVISSFDHQQLFWLRQNATAIPRGVLVGHIPLDLATCCDVLDAFSFHPSIDFISPELVADARDRDLQVWVYTVNEPADFRELSEMGVTGVFADYPERVIAFNSENRRF